MVGTQTSPNDRRAAIIVWTAAPRLTVGEASLSACQTRGLQSPVRPIHLEAKTTVPVPASIGEMPSLVGLIGHPVADQTDERGHLSDRRRYGHGGLCLQVDRSDR